MRVGRKGSDFKKNHLKSAFHTIVWVCRKLHCYGDKLYKYIYIIWWEGVTQYCMLSYFILECVEKKNVALLFFLLLRKRKCPLSYRELFICCVHVAAVVFKSPVKGSDQRRRGLRGSQRKPQLKLSQKKNETKIFLSNVLYVCVLCCLAEILGGNWDVTPPLSVII